MIKKFKSNLFFFILLFLVVFIVYGKAINFGLTNLDDDTFIIRHSEYLSNLINIPNFFLKDCYFNNRTQYYRPILSLSFSMEHLLFGTNLKIFHITNILLYIFALFTIFVFLAKLGFNKDILKFVILLFSVHPILSSVPVWIPARNDSLLIIFFLLSLINFIDYVKTNRTKYLILHFILFSLSLFLKETTALLIFIYPLLVYFFNMKTTKKQILNNLFFLVPILFIYFSLRSHSIYSVHISVYFNNSLYYFKNIIIGIMLYIEKIIYPTEMQILLYDVKPTIQTYIINIVVLSLLIYIYYKRIINRKFFVFAILFSFISMLPTFAQEEYAFLTHRLITSLTGIIIILTLLIEQIIIRYPKSKKYLIIIFVFIFLLFSVCSFSNIDKYKDSFTYWTHAYQNASNYYVVCDGLAKEYKEKKNFNKALELSLTAINLKKSFDNYLTCLNILINIDDLKNAKDLAFQMANIWNKNFLIYQHLSNIFLMERDYTNAIEYAKKAVEYSNSSNNSIDDKISSLENLVKIYAVSGNFQEAINILLIDLMNYDKNKLKYYQILSSLYEDLHDYDNSIIYIRKALDIEPNNEEYINQLKNIEDKVSAK